MRLTGEVEMDHRTTMASLFSLTLFSDLAFSRSLQLFVSRGEQTALLLEEVMRNAVQRLDQSLIPYLLQVMNDLEIQWAQEFLHLCQSVVLLCILSAHYIDFVHEFPTGSPFKLVK